MDLNSCCVNNFSSIFQIFNTAILTRLKRGEIEFDNFTSEFVQKVVKMSAQICNASLAFDTIIPGIK